MTFEDPSHMQVETTVKNPSRVARRRADICRAAVKLSRRKGFGDVTTRQIAKEAGLNIATMYQYVRSKEDIVFLICQQNIALIRSEVSEEKLDPVERLRTRFFALVNAVDERLHEVTFVYQESRSLGGAYLTEVKAGDEELVDYFEAAIDELLEDPHVHRRLMARQMVETGYLWANKNWALRGLMDKDEFARESWAMFAKALNA